MADFAQRSDLAAWLARMPCFASLRDTECRALAAVSRRRVFLPGRPLFQQDDFGSTLYVIRVGRVKIVRLASDGQETFLHVAGPGEPLGEIALLDEGLRSATAVALEPVEALAFARADVHPLLQRMPSLALALARELAGRVRQLDERLQEALWQDVPCRIARALLTLAERHGQPTPAGIRVHLALTHEEWGQYVGAVRQTVNPVLNGFRRDGVLSVDRRGFTVHQPDTLRASLEEG